MAEAISVASGTLTLAGFAFKSSLALYNMVKSFQSHQQRVKELLDELVALVGVLDSLHQTTRNIHDFDFSALHLPLLRCGKACEDFQEILKSSSTSSGSRTKFRDWFKLRYMGEDVDGFKRLIVGYKLTISIALADANLSRSASTAESVEQYGDMIETARAGLEDRLDSMDDKLNQIIQRASMSESDNLEIDLIKEERLSTEKCLAICANLSEHINNIMLTAKRGASPQECIDTDASPANMTVEGLQECRDSLYKTAQKLAEHERGLIDRLVNKSRSGLTSVEEREDLARLREEWEAARQGMDICFRACEHLKDTASTIDNHATGDAVQIMVSTSEKTIHGRNRGFGWRVRQVGGHMSEETLRDITRSFTSIHIPGSDDDVIQGASAPGQSRAEPDKTFKQQYGGGFRLK